MIRMVLAGGALSSRDPEKHSDRRRAMPWPTGRTPFQNPPQVVLMLTYGGIAKAYILPYLDF
jgi:hypothetical protein